MTSAELEQILADPTSSPMVMRMYIARLAAALGDVMRGATRYRCPICKIEFTTSKPIMQACCPAGCR